MCLIVRVSQEPVTLTKDKTVYKALRLEIVNGRREYISLHYDFFYQLRQEYTAEFTGKNTGSRSVADSRAVDYLDRTYPGWADEFYPVKAVGQGLHAATTPERLISITWGTDTAIFECTIPAGTRTYEDGDNLIVSEKLILNKILVTVANFPAWSAGLVTLEELRESGERETAALLIQNL